MYSDATRSGQHRFQQQNTSCHCRHCVQYGPPYQGGPGYPRPPPAKASDHPLLDLRGDVHSPSRNELEGRDFGPEKAEISGHRNPQRKPVFTAPGPYAQADDFSQSCPWDLNPAHWRYPGFREAVPRHYPPVRGEQCGGCVVWGVAGTHPFDTRHVPQQPQWPLPPAQFKGQTRPPRHVSYGPESERCWGCAGAEHYRLDTRVPEQSHFNPKPNGHCGQQPVYSQGGVDRDYHLDWSRLRGGSQGSCNGRKSSHEVFFSTEVPQRDLDHPRRRTPPPCDPGLVHGGAPRGKGPVTPVGSDPERQKGGQDSVREQIRQVVTDLEGVLGGLKQVHVEMKEVVQQIDRLTANIDLTEEGPIPSLPCDTPNPGALVYSHKTKGEQAPQRQHVDTVDHVILRTNSPSPVHMASVVKTNRVVPPSPSKDPHRDRRGLNGHPPHLCPPRDANHMTPLDPNTPPPRTLDPTVVVGNSTSYSRSQKPPPYPHNGRVERGGKGTAPPPPTSSRTPPYPAGKCRQSSSLV